MKHTYKLLGVILVSLMTSFGGMSAAAPCPDCDLTIIATVDDVSCDSLYQNDGAITLSVTGGSGYYDFSWTTSNGSGLDPMSQNQTGLTPGDYTVEITDQTNPYCEATVQVTVGHDQAPVCLSINSDALDLQVNFPPSLGETFQTEIIALNLSSVDPIQVQITATPFNVTQNDGSSGAAGTVAPSVITTGNLNLGESETVNFNYTVGEYAAVGDLIVLTFTPVTLDTNGYPIENTCACPLEFPFKIVPEIPVPTCDLSITSIDVTPRDCDGYGGTVTVNTVGGSGYLSYSLTPVSAGGINNTGDADGNYVDVVPGIYLVEVTDDVSGCSDCESVTVILDNPITIVQPIGPPGSETTFVVCSNDYPVLLQATPIGGTWTGNGVTDLGYGFGEFDPGVAGVGVETVSYVIGQCSSSLTFCVADCQGGGDCTLDITVTVEPGLIIEAGGNIEVCRDKEFCYEFTITNPAANMAPATNVVATGLIDPLWTIDAIEDCTVEPAVPYNGPVANIWTNPFDGSITFDQTGTGTWTIPFIAEDSSICLKICATAEFVGNNPLNIVVTQN